MLDENPSIAGPAQSDLFGGAPAPLLDWTPKSDDVRNELLGLLTTLEEAQEMPWSARRLDLEARTFPQMCRWLPANEASELQARFERELERLTG